jgi:molecular chaperone DnaJ
MSEVGIGVKISFKEAIGGVSKKISFNYKHDCFDCDGTGRDFSSEHEKCSDCKGQGKIGSQQGYVTIFLTCKTCMGRGWSSKRLCGFCNGDRKFVKEQSIDLKVPAGISNGNRLRVVNKKDRLIILVKIIILPSDKFIRDGNNIYSELDISLTEALLGCSKTVELVRKEYNLNIPECIQPGTKMRIKKQGTTDVQGFNLGDHYVKVNVKLPKKLNNQQKKLVEKLGKELKI